MIRRFLFFILLILASCRVPQEQIDEQNISEFYDPENPFIETRLWLYQDTLRLLIAFDKTEELSSASEIKNRFLFYGRTSEPISNTEEIYLDTVPVSPGKSWENKEQVILSYNFHRPLPGKLLILEIFDKRRRQLKLFDVQRWQNENVLFLTSANSPYLRSFLTRKDTVKVSCDNTRITLFYLKESAPFAALPYNTVKSDHTAKIDSFGVNCSELKYITGTDSIYAYIVGRTDSTAGNFLFCGKERFPKVSTPIEMVESLAYLFDDSTFHKIMEKDINKQTIDSLWLNIGKTESRGRDLIKAYYGRVEASNRYFTSIKEGWKTDPGMIYIGLGSPDEVYRHMNMEEWIYQNFLGKTSFNFYFKRNAAGELILQRKAEYRTIWTEAIKQWRSGIIPN